MKELCVEVCVFKLVVCLSVEVEVCVFKFVKEI